MIYYFYIAMFLLTIGMLSIVVLKFDEKISSCYSLLGAAIILHNYGAYLIVASKTIEEALVANKMVYLGGIFLVFFFVICIADICRISIPRWIMISMISSACVILVIILRIGKDKLYYESAELIEKAGYSFIKKEYGPLHIIFPIYLTVMLLFGISLGVYALKNKKKVSYITSLTAIGVMSCQMAVYVGERLFNIELELLPIGYNIAYFMILFLLKRVRLYNVKGITKASIEESDEYGYVVFDSKRQFCAGDENARKWFPELNECVIDYKLENDDTDFFKLMNHWMDNPEEKNTVYFERQGLSIGATHYIVKEGKRKTIHCIQFHDDTEEQKYKKLIENYNLDLENEVKKKTKKLRKVQNDIITSMASIVENRDSNTGGHIQRTSDVVRIFVEHLLLIKFTSVLTDEIAACIAKAAPLHDFGKIAIPDVILNKPGRFEPWEYEEMKKHPAKGAVIVAQILKNSDDEVFKPIAINVAHYHHERWDGNGYPDKLAGLDIPFEARVMALADVFDALVSKRVYKERMSYEKAFAIIEESKGTQFDPELCKEFLKCRDKLVTLYDSYEE